MTPTHQTRNSFILAIHSFSSTSPSDRRLRRPSCLGLLKGCAKRTGEILCPLVSYSARLQLMLGYSETCRASGKANCEPKLLTTCNLYSRHLLCSFVAPNLLSETFSSPQTPPTSLNTLATHLLLYTQHNHLLQVLVQLTRCNFHFLPFSSRLLLWSPDVFQCTPLRLTSDASAIGSEARVSWLTGAIVVIISCSTLLSASSLSLSLHISSYASLVWPTTRTIRQTCLNIGQKHSPPDWNPSTSSHWGRSINIMIICSFDVVNRNILTYTQQHGSVAGGHISYIYLSF